MNTYLKTFYHALYVGCITGAVIIICGWFGIRAWVVFFAWANYFLHGSTIKRAMKKILALILGVLIAYASTLVIGYLNVTSPEDTHLYITAAIIVVVATILVFLECIKGWGDFVPASFLATVLFFAARDAPDTFVTGLFLPLVFGAFVGYVTVAGRQALGSVLDEK